jgi:hypothetical protein
MLPPGTLFVLQIQNSHIQIDPRTLHPCQIIAIICRNDINRSFPNVPPRPNLVPRPIWYCFRLVVVLFRLMAAAWRWCRIPLSAFFVALFATPNDRKKSSQRVPPRSRLITNAPPPASADLRLVVVFIDKTAAIQDLCSALPQFFDVCHWGAPSPNQGIPPQQARSRASTAEATAWRARADVIVVETVDAKVYAAAARTPWLWFVHCWPVGARR